MTKKTFFVGVLAIALVFGMTVVGCDSDDPEEDTLPSILLSVYDDKWDKDTSTNGEVKVRFSCSEALTPSDLSWVTLDKFSIVPSGDGDRTVSISSVVLEPYNTGNVDAKLTLTRSAVPEGNARRTAFVYLTVPSSVESKWTVKWAENKTTFQF